MFFSIQSLSVNDILMGIKEASPCNHCNSQASCESTKDVKKGKMKVLKKIKRRFGLGSLRE